MLEAQTRAHVAKLAGAVLLIYYVKCNHESVNVLLLSTLQSGIKFGT